MSRNKPPKELELDGDEAAFLADMLAASCEIPQPDNTLPAAHAIGSVHQQAVITKPPPDVQQRLEPVQEASNELSGMSRSSPRLLMAAVYGGVLPPKQHDHEAPACHPPPRNLFTVDGDIPADAQLDRQVRLSTSPHQQQAPRSPLRPMSPARSQQSHAAVQAAPTLTAEEVQAMLQPLLCLEQVLADELASPTCGNARVLALASRLCSSYNSVSVKLLGGGALNQALEQLEKARVLLDQGSLLQDTFNYKELKAVTLNNLGCWYQYADMPDVALSHLQESAALRNEGITENGEDLAKLNTALRSLNSNTCDAQALPTQGDAVVLLNKAAATSRMGQHEQSLALSQQAAEVIASVLNVDLAAMRGAILDGVPQGELLASMPHLRRMDVGKINTLAMAVYNEAVGHEHLQNWEAALSAYTIAEALACRFIGCGADLTLGFCKALEAFRVRFKSLQRTGRVVWVSTGMGGKTSAGKWMSAGPNGRPIKRPSSSWPARASAKGSAGDCIPVVAADDQWFADGGVNGGNGCGPAPTTSMTPMPMHVLSEAVAAKTRAQLRPRSAAPRPAAHTPPPAQGRLRAGSASCTRPASAAAGAARPWSAAPSSQHQAKDGHRTGGSRFSERREERMHAHAGRPLSSSSQLHASNDLSTYAHAASAGSTSGSQCSERSMHLYADGQAEGPSHEAKHNISTHLQLSQARDTSCSSLTRSASARQGASGKGSSRGFGSCDGGSGRDSPSPEDESSGPGSGGGSSRRRLQRPRAPCPGQPRSPPLSPSHSLRLLPNGSLIAVDAEDVAWGDGVYEDTEAVEPSLHIQSRSASIPCMNGTVSSHSTYGALPRPSSEMSSASWAGTGTTQRPMPARSKPPVSQHRRIPSAGSSANAAPGPGLSGPGISKAGVDAKPIKTSKWLPESFEDEWQDPRPPAPAKPPSMMHTNPLLMPKANARIV